MDDKEAIVQSVFFKFSHGAPQLKTDQFSELLNALSKRIPSLSAVSLDQAAAVTFFYADKPNDGMTLLEFGEWWRNSNRYSFLIGEKAELFRKAYNLYKKYSKKEGMTYDEFDSLIREMKLNVSDDAFDSIDRDDDGLLNFSEFCEWLNWF